MQKYYIKYDNIHEEVENLFIKIKKNLYFPDVIIAIGTGGFIPARILKTFFNNIPIICITINYYDNDKIQKKTKQIQSILKNSPEHNMIKNKKIIIIDELDDTRTTLEYITNLLLEFQPSEMAIGVLYNKKKIKKGTINKKIKYFYSKLIKDYWIIFPWEICNIKKHNKRSYNRKKHTIPK